MKERPILFSSPMVRALLDGTKTQTRRIVKPQPQLSAHHEPVRPEPRDDGVWVWMAHTDRPTYAFATNDTRCPYGQPGDRLWVRESFSGMYEYEEEKWPPGAWFPNDPIWYWANGNPPSGDWTRPKPSIHMPRWASRITLEVTEIRVEPLHAIDEGDAVAEGASTPGPFAVHHFRDLWNSINGADAWAANPWVWVVGFRRVTP